jgi:hypothetical protein
VSPFDISVCSFEIEFNNLNDSFPRKQSQTIHIADFAIFNIPNVTFQTIPVSLTFDFVDYNWYAGGNSKWVSV